MTIRRIDHIQLAMPAGQEDLARAFYGDPLGNRIELMEIVGNEGSHPRDGAT